MITEGVEHSWRFRITLAAMIVLTAASVVLTGGNPVIAFLPLAILVLGYALFVMPLGVSIVAFTFACLLFDDPAENPGRGLFHTPFYKPGEFLYRALDSTLGIPGLKPFGIEVALWGLGLLALTIFRFGPPGIRRRGAPLDPRLTTASWVAVSMFAFLAMWGVLRGGVLRYVLLQSRAMLFAFLLPLVIAPFLKDRRYIHGFFATFLVVAWIRALMGIYYWATITRLQILGDTGGGSGDYVLTHSDAVLGAVSVTLCLVFLYHRPGVKALLLNAVMQPPLLFFMVVNNRRLAFVEVALALIFVYVISDQVRKRRVHLAIAASIPLIIGYIGAGWNSNAAWARPVQTLRQVSSSEDASSQTRDIENYNLTLTIKRSPILGSGFGHEYWEFVKAYDISTHFEAYLYVPHNSVLWLWSAAGLVGYTSIWMVLVIMVFLAARIYRSTRAGEAERMLAYFAVITSIVYGVQAFGDMGLQSWMASIILGITVALVNTTAARLDVCAPPSPEAGA